MTFNITGNRIIRTDTEMITSQNVNSVQCHFVVDETYAGLEQFAVFYRTNQTSRYVEVKDCKCEIPWELLKEEGILYVGFYGTLVAENSVTKRVTSNAEAIRIVPSLSEMFSPAPTPDMWEVYRKEILGYRDETQEFSDMATRAASESETNAESAAQSAKSAFMAAENAALSTEESLEYSEQAAQSSQAAIQAKNEAQAIKDSTEIFYDVRSNKVGFRRANEESFTYTKDLTGPKGETGAQGPQGLSGVYIGPDPMPEGYNVHINPNGTVVCYDAGECDARYANAVLGEAEGSVAELTDAWAGGVLSRCEIFGETTETGTGEKAPDNPYTLSGTVPTKINVNSENPSTAEGTPVTIELPEIEALFSAGETAKDSYDAVSGKVVRRTKKVVLSRAGQSGITYYSNAGNPNGDTAYFAYRSGFENAKGGCDFICSHFPRAAGGDALWATDAVASNMSNASFRFRLPKSEMPGWSDDMNETQRIQLLLTWLDNHEVTVICELPEPEEEEGETGTDIRIASSPAYVYTDQGGVGVTYTKDTNAVLAQLADRISALEGKA